jgi:hypothetical protein
MPPMATPPKTWSAVPGASHAQTQGVHMIFRRHHSWRHSNINSDTSTATAANMFVCVQNRYNATTKQCC